MKPRTILIAAYAVFLLYAWPGYMTTASVDQLVDSRTGSFTDWAPPVMTEIWRAIGFVWSGPAGMLVLQGGLLLGGAFMVLRRSLGDRAAAIAAACVLNAPPVIAALGVISPPAVLAASALGAFAALRANRRVLGLGLAFVACDAGGTLAMLPLIVGALTWYSGWRRWAIAVAAWAAVALCAFGAGRLLVDHVTERDAIELAKLDVESTLHQPVAWPANDAEADALIARRRAVIREQPAAYAKARWQTFSRVLGFHRPRQWQPVYQGFLGNPSQRDATLHLARHSAIQRALTWFVRMCGHTLLFHTYVFALLALILLPVAITRRHGDAALLFASGLLNEAALAITATMPEPRLGLWLTTATILGIVLLLAPRPSRAQFS